VRLATADGPDALCLQEVPVWALSRLEGWGGMQSFGVVASRPKLISAELGRLLTELNHGFFRSAFTGQANAILLAPALRPVGKDSIVLNPRSFRRAEAKRLGLDFRTRLGWAKERRVCQAVRMEADGRFLSVANLHASRVDRRCADAELQRAADFAESFAQPGDTLVLAGEDDPATPPEHGRLIAPDRPGELARAIRVALDYPDVELDHLLVDNAAMQLVSRPADFDVILTENLFGDILSDESAMLTGSLGMLPSASLGAEGDPGLFEPVHGSAPDIAGQGTANPLATFLSAAMLLRHGLDRADDATRIEAAVDAVLECGLRTADLAAAGERTVGTEEMTAAVLAELSA